MVYDSDFIKERMQKLTDPPLWQRFWALVHSTTQGAEGGFAAEQKLNR